MRTEYELVARVTKARGLEGEVTATSAGDLPFALHEGLHVYVVPPQLEAPRELTVNSVFEYKESVYIASFDEVDSIDVAEKLAGCFLLADVDDIAYDQLDDPTWCIDAEVVDERYGELGVITEVIVTPANDVWVVQGPYGEVLVPAIDEVIVDLPLDDTLPLVVHLMDGLIEQ